MRIPSSPVSMQPTKRLIFLRLTLTCVNSGFAPEGRASSHPNGSPITAKGRKGQPCLRAQPQETLRAETVPENPPSWRTTVPAFKTSQGMQ